MQVSSDEDEQRIHYNTESLNSSYDTAYSFGMDKFQHDEKLQKTISPKLTAFYKECLLCKKRKMCLEANTNIFKGQFSFHYPYPPLYFLPYTILMPNDIKLSNIRDIISKQTNPTDIGYNAEKDEISVTYHNHQELVYYKIRKMKVLVDHKIPACLDADLLISKLYEFYAKSYSKLNFHETGIFVLYWAYQKNLMRQTYLSESAIKMVVICLFMQLGFGMNNILQTYAKKNKNIFEEMVKMNRIKKNGDCILDPQLLNLTNYSIDEVKGFYLVDRRKYMKIQKICPIYFPINSKEYIEYQQTKKIRGILNHPRQISTAKLLYRFFKILSTLLDSDKNVTLDLKQTHKLMTDNYNDQSNIEIIHPVFGNTINSHMQKDNYAIRKVKSEVRAVYEQILHKNQPIDVFQFMFAK